MKKTLLLLFLILFLWLTSNFVSFGIEAGDWYKVMNTAVYNTTWSHRLFYKGQMLYIYQINVGREKGLEAPHVRLYSNEGKYIDYYYLFPYGLDSHGSYIYTNLVKERFENPEYLMKIKKI